MLFANLSYSTSAANPYQLTVDTQYFTDSNRTVTVSGIKTASNFSNYNANDELNLKVYRLTVNSSYDRIDLVNNNSGLWNQKELQKSAKAVNTRLNQIIKGEYSFAGLTENEKTSILSLAEEGMYDYYIAIYAKAITTGSGRNAKTEASEPAILIIQWQQAGGADKSALENALKAVPTTGYYKTEDNDKWNGKEYSTKGGFWAEMQAVVEAAKAVYDNDAATQDEVDAATASLNQENPDSDLSKAIAKLIPIEQLNATYLYETVTAEQKQNRQEGRYTVDTWADYAEAKSAAEHYLFEELFNAGGTANTEVNKAANQDEADGYARALIQAAENLYTVAARDAARKSLQRGWELLSALIELAEQAKEEDYTEESWDDFAAKLAEAKSIPEPVPTFTPVDQATAQALVAKYNELYQAFYCELIPKGTVTVTLQCLDPFHVRLNAGLELPYEYVAGFGTEIFAGALQEVTMTGSPTLAAALSAVGLSVNDAASNSPYGTKVLINGVYVTENYAEASYDTFPSIYSNLLLHPGDRVTVIWDTNPLSGLGQTVGYTVATLWQYENSLAAMRFAEGGETIETIEAHAAEPFTLVLEKTSAALTGERDYSPAEGMAVFVSETQTETAGNHPTATFAEENGERIRSAADGSITMTLYEEGWVLLAAFDVEADVMGDDATSGMTIGDYHSVNFGAAVWVHVLPAEDMEAVKEQLKEELTTLRDAYAESIFAETDWDSLRTIYENGLTDIDGAESIGAARSKQQTAIKEIRAIQEKTLRENEEKPAAFRAALAKMPEDLALLTEAQKPQVEALIAAYDALTPYQLTLLTESEIERYEEIKALYEAGLGASASYSLTLTVTADTAEATAAAQAFTAWLRAHTATADQIGDVPGVQLGEYGAFTVNNTPQADPVTAQPLQNIRLAANLNYSLWFLLREADSHTLSGDGWTVSDPNVTLSPSSRGLANDVTGSVTVLFGGVEYEVKGITVAGVDGDGLRWSTQSCLDKSTYKGKSTNDVNLYFDETWLEFSMPYQNVTVTIEWQPVSPMSKLEAAYRSYSKADYTAANWDILTAAYESGKEKITEAGTDVSTANTELGKALAAMAAVSPRGEGELGSVYVTVRNDTGKTADGAAWEGVRVEDVVVNLKQDSTMMSCIAEALTGRKVIGVETGYISSIDGLAEFSCGKKSGWMGTLNDWFVNEGFTQFSVANDKLHDGDVICVEYTCALGLDIRGGTETNKDTTLYGLDLTNGDLSPSFKTGVTEYVFTLESGKSSTVISFTNNNRAFQSRAYLNNYAPSANNWIRSGDTVTVSGGDVIYVGVGESVWPAMGKGVPTKYQITVVSPDDASAVVKLISAIGSVTYENYKDKQAAVEMAKTAYEALTDAAKEDVGNYGTLEAAEAAVEGFRAVDGLKAAIAKLPNLVEDTQEDRAAVETARTLYGTVAKSQELLDLLTLLESRKYHKADNTLTLIDELAKITDKLAAGIDFKHTEVENKKEMVRSALVDWFAENTSLLKDGIDVDPASLAFTEASRDKDGNYRAEVTLTCGGGAAAAIRTLTVEGKIIYVVSSEAGVTWIEIDGIRATPSKETENVWEASMPYGTDLATLTAAKFEVLRVDEKATPEVTKDETVSDGSKWIITVTAEDGTTTQTHIVTLTVSNVKVTVLDSWVYYVSDDVEPVKLDASAVVGLQKAVNPDKLGLDKGTTEAFLWLEVRQKSESVFTVTPVYAPVGEQGKADPEDFFNGSVTLTLPVPGTEYAKVLFGETYLDATGSESGITFTMEKAGDYTLIPNASIATVTFHLNGGTGDMTDGEKIVYTLVDIGKELPGAGLSGAKFEGWYDAETGGTKYTAVSADLPEELYARWSYNVLIDEWGDIEGDVTVTATVSGGTATITVAAKEPCVVIVQRGESYERLETDGENPDGSYSFEKEGFKADMVFWIAVLGDFDEDGDLDKADFTAANKAILNSEKIDTLQLLVMGANGKKLKTVDLAKLYLALVSGKVEW